MTSAPVRGLFHTPARLGWGLGLFAFLAVFLTLGDPGITVDEPLDVRPGRKYVATLRAKGLEFFSPEIIRETYLDNKEHPPLGRWLLGIASTVGEPFEALLFGADPLRTYIGSARFAPALAFAILVGLIVATTMRQYGRASGIVAGVSLIMMPRVFAHAHLAVLDTFVALFWTWSLLSIHQAATSSRPWRGSLTAGIIWGLALLTKIHGWLLPPLVVAYLFWKLPWKKALGASAIWLVVGLTLFFVGWPWLWDDPVGKLSAYLRTGVHRVSIQVLYFGHVYADRDVPWHYPWVYFLVTVPLGLQALGVVGLVRSWRERRSDWLPFLAVAAMLELLVLFSTNTPVYDGERLFLPVFALWAILIGKGFGVLWGWRTCRLARTAMGGFVLAQAVGLLMIHPFGLSYYNALVGGLAGAERLGLELTYWGDAVDPVLLDQVGRLVPPEGKVALMPTLAPNQGVFSTTRGLAAKSIVVQDQESAPGSQYLVIYRRSAYWNDEAKKIVQRAPLFVRSRQGVWLSGIWEQPKP